MRNLVIPICLAMKSPTACSKGDGDKARELAELCARAGDHLARDGSSADAGTFQLMLGRLERAACVFTR